MQLGQRVADRGNYLYINGQTPVIQGYTGVSNYSESPFGGSTKTPSFEISPDGIFYDAMSTTIYSYQQLGGISTVGYLKQQSLYISGQGSLNQEKQYGRGYQGALQVRYYHRRGLHNMIISGVYDADVVRNPSGGGRFSSIVEQATIKIEIKDRTGTVVKSQEIYNAQGAGPDEINVNVSLDALSYNSFYTIELYIKSSLVADYIGQDSTSSASLRYKPGIKSNLYITAVT